MVSILIVLDDTLVLLQFDLKLFTEIRLNPYCAGRYSSTPPI